MAGVGYRGERFSIDENVRENAPGQFVLLSNGFTHYEYMRHDGNSLVIFVHGLSVPYYIWDKNYFSLYKNGFSVLRYDLFGRGFSDRPDCTYDIGIYVTQLYDLIDKINNQAAVHLIGLSFGGIIVTVFANQYPSLVEKIVLIDPAGHPLKYAWLIKLMTSKGFGDLFFRWLGNGYLFQQIISRFFAKNEIEEFVEKYKVQMQYRGFKRALMLTLRNSLLWDYSSEFKKLGNSHKPVLLIWGTEDQSVPFVQSRLFMKEMPNLQFIPVDGAGHIPQYEKPEIVNPLIIEFLESR